MISDENYQSNAHDKTHNDKEEKDCFRHEEILKFMVNKIPERQVKEWPGQFARQS